MVAVLAMSAAIRIIGLQTISGVTRCLESGRYICDFDAEQHDGRSAFRTTRALHEAAIFVNEAAAIGFYRTQSRVRPLRDDGRPNRPLTAFTVEIVSVHAGAEITRP